MNQTTLPRRLFIGTLLTLTVLVILLTAWLLGTRYWPDWRDHTIVQALETSRGPATRESTRLTCMAVQGAQSSYDPRFIKELIGGRAHEHPALTSFYGLRSDEIDSPRAHKLYEEASPINYVSAGDPPVFMFYNEPKGPLPADAKPGVGIHHPKFGEALKAKLDPLGIDCVLRHADDYRRGSGSMYDDMMQFLVKRLSPEQR